FWNTVKKIGKSYAYDFKLDKKKRRVDTEPWRTFAAIINMCISRKTTGLDRLKELRAQIFLSGTIKFVAKTKDCQKYGALILDGMINQNVKDSKTYKTYYNFANGKVEPKKARKFNKRASPRLKTILSSPNEHTQRMKKSLKKSRRETHKLQTSGSNKGADFELEFHDESMGKPKDTSEGTGMKLGVLDMSKEDSSYSEVESWGDSKEESDDDNVKDKNDDDNEEDGSDNDDCGNDDEDYKEEKQYEEFMLTPERNKSDDDDNMYEEEDDDVANELPSDKKKSSKDAETSKGSKSNESKLSSSSKGTQSQHKSFGKSTPAEEPKFKAVDTEMQQDQENESGHIDDQSDNEAAPKHDCKPLPLIEDQGRQVVPADYFKNNDLKYQKGRSSSRKYVTSTTRTKTAKYENIEGVEDMVPRLWIPVKVAYNKHVVWGTYIRVQNDNDSMHTHATGNLLMMSTLKKELLR
nr:hypothetical protein [Tanacetum cinerariifolium]